MKGKKRTEKVKHLNVALPVRVYEMLGVAVKASIVKTDMTRLIQDAIVEKYGKRTA